jgi:hypothetical protein
LHSIEKAQHHVFAQFLDLLQKHRGDLLDGAVSESVFDSLIGTATAPPFAFKESEYFIVEAAIACVSQIRNDNTLHTSNRHSCTKSLFWMPRLSHWNVSVAMA